MYLSGGVYAVSVSGGGVSDSDLTDVGLLLEKTDMLLGIVGQGCSEISGHMEKIEYQNEGANNYLDILVCLAVMAVLWCAGRQVYRFFDMFF